MKDYGRCILDRLLDKYEKNSKYGQPEEITRGIFFYFRKKYLPDYFIEQTSEYKLKINADCLNLEKKGFLNIIWVKFEEGNLIDKIRLNLEQVEDIYEYLQREPLLSQEKHLLKIINDYRQESPEWLRSFYDYLVERLKEHNTPVYLKLDQPESAKQLFTVLNAAVRLEEETPIRLFSLKHTGNSKLFYKLQDRLIHILRDFCPQATGDLGDNELLAETGLVPNPDYLYLSGPLSFVYQKSKINTDSFNPDLGLPVKMLQDIEITGLKADYVLTIENLTPYHEYIENNGNKGLVIYLGGFHNRWRRMILILLKDYINQNRPGLPFYHWGDIDYGGFMILKHLRAATGINFQPYRMDIQTLKRYQKYCQQINEKEYLNKLKKLLNDELLQDIKPTVQYMIEKRLRLEQEALLINI